MFSNKLAISLLLALIIGLAIFNLFFSSGNYGGDPLKGADELSLVPDEQLEGAVLTELGRSVYGGDEPQSDAWKRLNQPARHLWSVARINDIDPVTGLVRWLAGIKAGSTAPHPEDMRAGLGELGLTEARKVMDEIIGQRDNTDTALMGKLHGQLGQALNHPDAKKTRQTWVREHLRDLL